MIRWRHNRRAGLGGSSPRPYGVLCIGEGATLAPGTISYVDRMRSRLSPHYGFIKSAAVYLSVLDFSRPLDLDSNPYSAAFINGAYETLVEPHLAATTSIPLDLATIMLGAADAAGLQEDTDTSAVDFVDNMKLLCDRLLTDGVGRVYVVLTGEYQYFYSSPPVEGRIGEYRDALVAAIPTWSTAFSYVDVFEWWDPAIHAPGLGGLGGYPTQEAQDLMAVQIGDYITLNP